MISSPVNSKISSLIFINKINMRNLPIFRLNISLKINNLNNIKNKYFKSMATTCKKISAPSFYNII